MYISIYSIYYSTIYIHTHMIAYMYISYIYIMLKNSWKVVELWVCVSQVVVPRQANKQYTVEHVRLYSIWSICTFVIIQLRCSNDLPSIKRRTWLPIYFLIGVCYAPCSSKCSYHHLIFKSLSTIISLQVAIFRRDSSSLQAVDGLQQFISIFFCFSPWPWRRPLVLSTICPWMHLYCRRHPGRSPQIYFVPKVVLSRCMKFSI